MRWRLQEREILQFKSKATQLKHHIREITAPDFRLRKLVSLLEIFRRIESNANARLHASRTPCALPGTRLRNILDGQPLDSGLRIVPRDAGRSRIHHIGDSRNGQRRFGNIGCQHHAGLSRMLKDAALFIGTHTPVKRQDIE